MCRANLLALRIDIAQGMAYFCTRRKYVESLKQRKTERQCLACRASGANSAKPKGRAGGSIVHGGNASTKGEVKGEVWFMFYLAAGGGNKRVGYK